MDTYNPDSLVFVHFYLSPLKELLHNDFPISKVSTCIYIQSNKIIFQDLFNKNLHFEFAFDEFSSYDLTKPQKSRPQFDITLYKKKNKYEKKSVFFTFYTAPFVPERDQEFADILNPQPFIDLIKKHVEPLFDPYNY